MKSMASFVFLAICGVSWCGVSWGQTPLEPKHIAQLKSVSSAEISPDGKWVAYNLSIPRKPMVDDDGRAWRHLYVCDMAGHTRAFVTGEQSIGAPHWSADSRQLWYTAKRGDDEFTSLYRIPIDGGESEKILEHTTSMGSFSLHPDGTQVAFLATESKADESKRLEKNGFDQEIFEEDWRRKHVWLAPIDGSTPPKPIKLSGSAMNAHWSPSGERLAVMFAPTPSVDDSYMAKQIAIVDVKTQSVVRQVEHASKMGDFGWSPDGTHLAIIAGADIHDPKDGRLMVWNVADGGRPADLMPNYDAHVTSFQWLTDKRLIWTAGEGTLSRVGTVNLSKQVESLVQPSADAGIISHISVASDGTRAAVLNHQRNHYVEAYSLDVPSGKTSRLTDSNPWTADIDFARQETISWKAKDGLELQGVLVFPSDFQTGKRYPMIMLVHGGPESHESDGWVSAYSKPGHMAAARGFFVFYPNYRGSTGRGVKFSMMGQADAANKEFSDLIDGIDHLVEKGWVDPARVGITGGSYGGYASAWGATYYSDRFAASVMFVGISDNVSKVGTTDIPEEMFLVHHRMRLWDDWDYFLKSSPIRYVQRNRTPTLILHGKEDPRVHPSQSLELHRHLKTLGQAPVRLVLYEGEGHGNRKAAARLDYNLRQLRWMEHFLQAPHPNPSAPDYELDYEAALGIKTDKESSEVDGQPVDK